MDNLAQRFIMGISPVITVTKCHDLKTGEFFFDLYLDGKVEGRYNFTSLNKKLQEVVLDI